MKRILGIRSREAVCRIGLVRLRRHVGRKDEGKLLAALEPKISLFLSYPRELIDRAWEIHEFLQEIDVEVWFDKTRLTLGDNWEREIELGLRSADLAILLISPQSFSRSGVIHQEMRRLLEISQRKPLGQTFIMPVVFDGARVSLELESIHYVQADDFWRIEIARAIRASSDLFESRKPFPDAGRI